MLTVALGNSIKIKSMRNIKFSIDEYYHVYNRGVDKRIIFLDKRDRERFLCLLFLSNSTKFFNISNHCDDPWSFDMSVTEERGDRLVSICAWVLMPNHFHFLIKEEVEGGISKFMQRVSAGYTKYFNKKYHRTGSLLEGTFKAEHADEDRYLKYLLSYIHLNPIGIIDKGWKNKKIEDKNKALDFLKSYQYSSLPEYLREKRNESLILNISAMPDYFHNKSKSKIFDVMVREWIEFERVI